MQQCLNCLVINPDHVTHCYVCDANLAHMKPLSERRRVTTMFADLVGFTNISEQLDPEHVHQLLNACFDTLVPIIEQFSGRVDKFIGDAIMALWGAPLAHEDDPIRAVHAAQSMLNAIDEFNRNHQTEFALHIGINTGLVVAGNLGSKGRATYSVIGDAVNLAARLEDLAQAGEIIVGAETQRLTAHIFDYLSLEPLQIKGKSQLISAYRLLGLHQKPTSGRGIHGLSSPMVGRDAELQQLIELTKIAIHTDGGIAVIVGEAGIGKSRLLTEWYTAIQTLHPNTIWTEGRSLSYTVDSAYYLLRDIARSFIGVGVNATNDEIATELAKIVETNGLDQETHIVLRQLLLLDEVFHQNPQSLQAHYVMALRNLVQFCTQTAPLLCVLEDLHWADHASIDVLLRLLPLLENTPFMLVATSRPDRKAHGWRLVDYCESLETRGLKLELSTLSAANSQELVAHLLQFDSLPESVRSLILTKADGNPFFMEEVIRSLIERGVIEQRNNQWIATNLITTIELPDTLHGVLAARIDRLPLELRELLKVAAVVGRRFAVRVVADVLHHSRTQLKPQMQDLLDAELIRNDLTKASEFFRFRHALVHEVVYNTILHDERRRLHLAVGRVLERIYANRLEELAPTLAQHFTIAQEPDALKYWLMAGDVAYRQYAVTEAINYYANANQQMQIQKTAWDANQSCNFYLNYGRALELDSRSREALNVYITMQAAAQAGNDLRCECIALIEQVRLYVLPSFLRSSIQAQELAEPTLAMAQRHGWKEQLARLYWILALNAGIDQDFDRAFAYGDQASDLARELNDRELLAHCLHDFHRGSLQRNNIEEAKAMLYEAITMWRELGNLPMLADGLASAADLSQNEFHYEQAIAMAQEAERISQTIGNRWNLVFSRLVLGEIAIIFGHTSEALEIFNSVIILEPKAAPLGLTLQGYEDLFYLYLLFNNPEAAKQILVTGEVLIADVEPSQFTIEWIARCKSGLALCALKQGDWDTAEHYLNQAQAVARVLSNEKNSVPVPMIERVRAEMARLHDDWDTAHEHMHRYTQQFRPFFTFYPWVKFEEYDLNCAYWVASEEWQQLKNEALAYFKEVEIVRDQHWIWRIAVYLIIAYQQLGDHSEAAHYYTIARAALDYILEHTQSAELRNHLLNLPQVQAVFSGQILEAVQVPLKAEQ